MKYFVTQVYKPGCGQHIDNTEYTTEENAVSAYVSELWAVAARGETDLYLLTLSYGSEVKRGTYFGLEGKTTAHLMEQA